MYNLDDQNLDRLSKEAAEHYKEPKGNPSWEAMQRRLNKELPEEEKKRRGFLWIFLFFGLLAGGSFYWYSQHKQNTIQPPAVAVTNQDNKPAVTSPDNTRATGNTPATGDKIANGANKNTSNSTDNNPPAKDNNNTDDKNNRTHAPVDVQKSNSAIQAPVTNEHTNPATTPGKLTADNAYQPAQPADKPIRQKEKQQPVVAAAKNKQQRGTDAGNNNSNPTTPKDKHKQNLTVTTGIAKSQQSHKDDVVNDKPVTAASKKQTGNNNDTKDNTTKQDDTNTTATTTDVTVAPPVNNAADKNSTATDSAKTKDAVTTVAADKSKDSAKTAQKKKTDSKKEKAYSIGLVAGADLSTVKFKYSENLGFNVGLMGAYYFNKNWAVRTGLIYTKKIYKLGGEDFNAPDHYFTNYVDLQTVDGYCRMWEVPLLARYTFNSKSANKFFVSTGISSYFMKENHYTYNYKLNGVPTTRSWDNMDDYNHLFSILHLSAGFEKQLGKNWNWQIEPYAKLPLSGVGFGSIKLSSFGLNLAVQYKHKVK